MRKLALVAVMAVAIIGCKASVKVQAKTPEVKKEEPAPAPPPPPAEEPKQGEQIVLPEQIEFETNDAKIKQTETTLAALNKLAEVMKKHPNITKLRIEGHTDNRGKAKRNDKLSQARADAVAKWLTEHEVAATRLTTKGFGASKPVVENDTEAHRQMNRRTEYYVDEVDGKKVDGSAPTTVATGPATGGKGKN